MAIRRSLAGLAFLFVMSFGALPGPAEAADTLKLAIPALTGKSKVGTRSFELVDRSRPAGFDQSGKRRLMVQFTYPRKRSNCRTAPYMAAGPKAALMSDLMIEEKVTGNTRTCVGGAVIKRKLPVVVFSHAYTANRSVYTSLVADLASRGFMVASLDHTYDAFSVQFPGGKVVPGLYGSPLASEPITEPELDRLIRIRTRDVRFVTTWILRQNRARKSWLKQRIDPKRLGIFGHSLGGATATRVGLVDKRFRASADVDGSLFGEWPLTAKSRKPFLLFTATDGLSSVLPEDKSCRFFGNAARPKLAWELTGAKHLTFSDFQALAPQIAEKKPDWAYAALYPVITGSLNPAASIRSQRNAIVRFFRAYVMSGKKPGKVRAPTPPAGVTPISTDKLTCAEPD